MMLRRVACLIFGLLLLERVQPAPDVRCDFFTTPGGFLRAKGGASGNLRCGQWPSLEAAKQECWTNRDCDGLSWGRWGKGLGGCLKKNRSGGFKRSRRFQGHHKTTMGCCSGDNFIPGQCRPMEEKLVSLRKPATQSSTAYGAVAGRAVDGNVNTNFGGRSCTHTKNTKSPWWQVDLGRPFQVTKVVITNRGDCCWNRLSGFKINVGNKQPFGANPTCVDKGKQGKGETREWNCPLTGRYVTVSLKGSGYLTLCEVQVFATVASEGIPLSPPVVEPVPAVPSIATPSGSPGSGQVYPGSGAGSGHSGSPSTPVIQIPAPVPSTSEGYPGSGGPSGGSPGSGEGYPGSGGSSGGSSGSGAAFPGSGGSSGGSPGSGEGYPGSGGSSGGSPGSGGEFPGSGGSSGGSPGSGEGYPGSGGSSGGSPGSGGAFPGSGGSSGGSPGSGEGYPGSGPGSPVSVVPQTGPPSNATTTSAPVAPIQPPVAPVAPGEEYPGSGEGSPGAVPQEGPPSNATTTASPGTPTQTPVVQTSPGTTSEGIISVGKNARQSTTGYNGLAQYGNDGDPNSIYGMKSCSSTTYMTNPWWEVDLAATYQVTKVVITNRGDCCWERLTNMKISVGDQQPYTLNPTCMTGASLGQGESKSYPCSLTGRYVTISLDMNQILTLCEVTVYGMVDAPAPIDEVVSLNKPTTQAGTTAGGESSRAVDGNINSIYSKGSCTSTNNQLNPWWQVDLGKSYEVTKVLVTNRGDCCSGRLSSMEIHVGDNQPYSMNEACITGASQGPGETMKYNCALTGRYVTIALAKSTILTLCEVTVYAKKESGTAAGVSLPTPPFVQPPVIEPPVIQPPVVEPPVIEPPVIEPPVIQPPVIEPPVVEPPVTEPPVVEPPAPTAAVGGSNEQIVSDGKNVRQSSTAFGGVAQRGNDGNQNSVWAMNSCTHTNYMKDPWWEVDLGKTYQVTKVVITNRGDCCWDRLKFMEISVGDQQPFTLNPSCVTGGQEARGEAKSWNCSLKGRYVTVSLRATNYLTLCEVQVYALTDAPLPADELVSPGKNVIQSSTAFGGVAQRAIDGDINSQWPMNSCTHTNLMSHPWWQIDLGKTYQVSRVKITNRGDCCWTRLSKLKITVGDKQPYSLNPSCVVGGEQVRGETKEWKCPLKGRYVAISLEKTDYLTLCEVQVFAVRGSGAPPHPPPGGPVKEQLLSKGKNCRQSNTAFGGVCSRGVDGSRNSVWGAGSCTHTNLVNRPWWEVDLGRSYKVTKVIVTNRGDCCWDRLNHMRITVGDKQPYGLNPSCVTGAKQGKGETRTYKCPLKGRYVTISLDAINYLTLCEVEVYGLAPVIGVPPPPGPGGHLELVSDNKPCRQSSTAFGGDASRAVDGNKNVIWGGKSCTHTNLMAKPWWEVDLGKPHNVVKVVITNRGDCCWTRLKNFKISVGNKQPYGLNPACVVNGAQGMGETKAWKCELNGRYVTINLQGTDYLTLCEVQVYARVRGPAPPPKDYLVSYRKPVKQSSVAYGGIPQRAVDGNTNSMWAGKSCTHTNLTPSPVWWQVDLGATLQLTRVKITNRGDCCWGRLKGFRISVGDTEAYENSPKCVNSGDQGRGETKEWPCNLKGRYVTVSIAARQYLTLCEVQVFATSRAGGAPPPATVEQLVSLKKPTKQSTTGWGGVSSRGNDGNKNSVYGAGSCTHTSFMAEPWWRVDLQKTYRVNRVVITNRGDCCWDRLNWFRVSVGDNPDWKKNKMCVRKGIQGRGETKSWNCPLVGRFVTVSLPGTQYLTLCEVQVFAKVPAGNEEIHVEEPMSLPSPDEMDSMVGSDEEESMDDTEDVDSMEDVEDLESSADPESLEAFIDSSVKVVT